MTSNRRDVVPTRRRAAVATRRMRRSGNTRERLLEIAGRVFTEKGFAGATAKEICKHTGVNAAAVVYHFGGLEGLYRAVLQEALNRLVPASPGDATAQGDPEERLTAFIESFVRLLSSPDPSKWAMRLVCLEMVSPRTISDTLRFEGVRKQTVILQHIVSGFTGLSLDHPIVLRSCLHIIASLGVLLLIGRRRIEHMVPAFTLGAELVQENTRHMLQFTLGGLGAVGDR
jgi:AcrR family transcriptional regulator